MCHLCPDHVISTGRQMKNLVLNFEYLLLLCFFKHSWVLQFGAPSRYYKCALTQKRWFWLNWTFFRSNFNVSWTKIKTNIQYLTLKSSFDALSNWNDPHLNPKFSLFNIQLWKSVKGRFGYIFIRRVATIDTTTFF